MAKAKPAAQTNHSIDMYIGLGITEINVVFAVQVKCACVMEGIRSAEELK